MYYSKIRLYADSIWRHAYCNNDVVVIGSSFVLKGNTILKQNERKKGIWFGLLVYYYTIFYGNLMNE